MGLTFIPHSVLCIAASVAVVILFERGQRSRVARQMSSRAPLSDEAFGATFFPVRWTEAASRIRRIVGEQLEIDMSRTLPSDRFLDNLRMDYLDSLASITILMQIEEEFGIKITDEEAERIITIEQLVYCVGCKLDSKPCLPDQEIRATIRSKNYNG